MSAKTGMKARMMITIAKKIGRPTCCAALSVACQVSAGVSRPAAFLLLRRSQCRMTFSVITMPGIHQHADGDGNAAQRHDVGGDAELPSSG